MSSNVLGRNYYTLTHTCTCTVYVHVHVCATIYRVLLCMNVHLYTYVCNFVTK